MAYRHGRTRLLLDLGPPSGEQELPQEEQHGHPLSWDELWQDAASVAFMEAYQVLFADKDIHYLSTL